MRSLPDIPYNYLPPYQALDPWVWAFTKEINLVGAVFASHPAEAVIEDAAIEVTVNDPFDIRAQKP